MSDVTLNLENLTAGAPLWKQFPGQHSPQPAYVQMTEDGEVTADYSGEVSSAVPMRVWHNRTLRWSVQPSISGLALRKFLEVSGLALLKQILAGHTVDWDGSNQVGRLNDDATVASERFDSLLGDLPCCEIWTASDFLFSANKLRDIWPADKTLEQAIASAQADIENYDDGVVRGGVKDALLDQAAMYAERGSWDGLDKVHVDALLADERITTAEAAEWAEERVE